jgi:catechol 2,3-dioxygenase
MVKSGYFPAERKAESVQELTRSPLHQIHPETKFGVVALVVADLERSIAFYTRMLGMQLREQAPGRAVLGTSAGPLLLLDQQPGAGPKPKQATGLYHVAFLLPARRDLARSLQRLRDVGHPIRELEDHLVSESIYLADPDGNGIELYRDRPRAEWPIVDGRVTMGSRPIDVPDLLGESLCDGYLMSPGVRIGHLHLQVADLRRAEEFYCGVLGFELMARMDGALFVAAGGYHHHLGLNVWYSQGGSLPPAESAGMRAAVVLLPDEDARAAVRARLTAANVASEAHADVVALADPWGNRLLLAVGTPLPAALR